MLRSAAKPQPKEQAQTNNPIATKNTKKASSHTVIFRALISAANRFPAKYDFARKETAAPIGALLMTESTQRPFCVFCGNWIVGLSELRHKEIICKKINSQG
ncbi:MAG: hypothetical protein LBM04_03770 [Opitutaceae bacterium]|jgi:hypothetical protein|nr:hypothetical protein [Opitutaceae bacterium]